jgi:hypothetical protein
MRYFAVFALVLLALSTATAVELKPAPIQSQMRQSALLAQQDDFDDFDQPPAAESERLDEWGQPRTGGVSTLKAAAYSALLPGMGEYYVGHRGKAKYFFGIEAAVWISFFAYRTYGGWKKDDLIDYAAVHANASLEGKDDEFLDFVGFYDDIDQYNTFGRVYDVERPYLEDNADNHWRWQSDDDQAAYRHLKNQGREAYRRANFMLGLAVLNRIVSVIDAVRDARRSETLIRDDFTSTSRYKLEVDPLSPRDQVRFTLYTDF